MSVPRECYYLDVSELPPPEPMIAALGAIGKLQPGFYIQLHHWREPLLLYEKLVQRGFCYDARRGAEGSCEIFIWKKLDRNSAEAVARATCKLPEWSD